MRPRDLILVTGALVLATATPAAAAPGGSLTFFPSASIDLAAIKARTSAGCPDQADSYFAVVKGHGFPADGQIVTTPTAAGMSHTASFDVFFAQTMKDFATDNRTTLKGKYDVAVYCIDSFLGTKFAEFTGSLTFTSPTKFKASGQNTTTSAPAAPAPTQPRAAAAPPTEAQTAEPPAQPTTAQTEIPDKSGEPELVASARTPEKGLPVGWIATGIAAVLLAFEIGRRFGRRSAHPRGN
jgi:hypothetical protein